MILINRYLYYLSLVLVISMALILVTGCSEEPTIDVEQLQSENSKLKQKVAAQDSIVTRIGVGAKFVNAYLDSLDQLERTIKEQLAKRKDDSAIVDKVKSVTMLVNLNRNIVQDLRESLGDDNLAAKLLLDHVVKLDAKVKSQELKIALLNEDLDELGNELRDMLGTYAELETKYQVQKEGFEKYKSQVKDLESELTEKEEMLNEKEAKLNTAYYYFADKRELMSMGIVKKSNLFTLELAEDFNIEALNKIDTRSFKKLEIPTDDIELISDHPTASYKIINSAESSELEISDPAKFWSITKTLIIQTD